MGVRCGKEMTEIIHCKVCGCANCVFDYDFGDEPQICSNCDTPVKEDINDS
jgi:hypothetical protein